MGPARRPRSHPPPLRGGGFLGEIPKSCGGLGGLTPNKTPVGATNQLGGKFPGVATYPSAQHGMLLLGLYEAEQWFSPEKPGAGEMRRFQRCHRDGGGWDFFPVKPFFLIGRYLIDRYIISVKWELCNIDL